MMEKQKKKLAGWLGNTPFPPDQKKPMLIKDFLAPHLYGFDNLQDANRGIISTDTLLVSEWRLAPGKYMAPAGMHLYGEECYYVMEGEGAFCNPETGDTFILRAGDLLYIPQSTRHQIFNFSDKLLRVMSCQAPKCWGEDEIGTKIPDIEEPLFYVPKPFMEG